MTDLVDLFEENNYLFEQEDNRAEDNIHHFLPEEELLSEQELFVYGFEAQIRRHTT